MLWLAGRLNRTLGDVLTLLLTGGTLALYVQGNFLNMGAMQLDGSMILYEPDAATLAINTAIWVVITVLPLCLWLILKKKRGAVMSGTRIVCLYLTLVQLATTVYTVASTLPEEQSVYSLTDNQAFEVSETENVVVFIMDNVGERYLSKLIAEEPQLLEDFTGFTHYTNLVGAFRNTAGSFATFLTGQIYLNETSFGKFTAKAMETDDYWSAFKDMGYSIFMGESGASNFLMKREYAEYFDNLEEYQIVAPDKALLVRRIMHLALLRFAPEALKPFLYVYKFQRHINDAAPLVNANGSEVFKKDNVAFKRLLAANPLTTRKDKRYLLYFIFGAHTPMSSDENCEPVELYQNDFYTPLKGCMKVLGDYIRQLKALNVYDDTAIVITSDHADKPQSIDEIYNPILMIKPRNADGAIVDNSAPIHYTDIRPTIMELAGGDGSKYGTTVYDWQEGDTRQRYYYAYNWLRTLNSHSYFTPIVEFTASDDGKTYTRTGAVYEE